MNILKRKNSEAQAELLRMFGIDFQSINEDRIILKDGKALLFDKRKISEALVQNGDDNYLITSTKGKFTVTKKNGDSFISVELTQHGRTQKNSIKVTTENNNQRTTYTQSHRCGNGIATFSLNNRLCDTNYTLTMVDPYDLGSYANSTNDVLYSITKDLGPVRSTVSLTKNAGLSRTGTTIIDNLNKAFAYKSKSTIDVDKRDTEGTLLELSGLGETHMVITEVLRSMEKGVPGISGGLMNKNRLLLDVLSSVENYSPSECKIYVDNILPSSLRETERQIHTLKRN